MPEAPGPGAGEPPPPARAARAARGRALAALGRGAADPAGPRVGGHDGGASVRGLRLPPINPRGKREVGGRPQQCSCQVKHKNCKQTNLCPGGGRHKRLSQADKAALEERAGACRQSPCRYIYGTVMTMPPGTTLEQQLKRAKLVLTLGYSLQQARAQHEFVVFVASDGSETALAPELRAVFERAGFTVRADLPWLKPPSWAARKFQWSFSKFNLRKLEEYDKILILDNDMIVMKNLDHLFSFPTPAGISETERAKTGSRKPKVAGKRSGVTPPKKPAQLCPNGGFQLFRPSRAEFEKVRSRWEDKRYVAYNGGEQGFLCNNLQKDSLGTWFEFPYKYNTFVSDWLTSRHEYAQAYVLHYISLTKEKDLCWEAYKKGRGCGFEAHVQNFRTKELVRFFWDTFLAMTKEYGVPEAVDW